MEKIKDLLYKYVLKKNDNTRLLKKINNKFFRLALIAISYLCAILFPAVCYLTVELIHFASMSRIMLITFLTTRTSVAIGMCILMYIIWAVMLLLFEKVAVANALLGVITILSAIGSHLKYLLTGDFFYPWDIVHLSNVSEIADFLEISFPPLYMLISALVLMMGLFPALINMKINIKPHIGVIIAVFICVFCYSAVSTPKKVENYLANWNMDLVNAALQTSNYIDNGLIGGFALNVLSLNIEKPENYSKDTVDSLFTDYEDIPMSEDFSYPDIIVILSESFWDPKSLPGSSFTDKEGNDINPIKNFDEISSRPGAISGLMANTALGGGTVRPEFEILTGLSTDYLPSGSVPYTYLNKDTSSYISEYRDLGYKTFAIHPYLTAFYSRVTGYPYIGIDSLHFEEEITEFSQQNESWNFEIRGKYISDKSFIEYLKMLMEENKSTDNFVMGISMEAHQPYETKFTEADLEVFAHNEMLDQNVLGAFRNFTMAMYDADNALGDLVEWIDNRDKETVLVYFGDHLPTLVQTYSAYLQTGMISSSQRNSVEERLVTQRTPFLIYSNFELNEGTLLHQGNDNEIASYNLLNGLSELIGSPRNVFMQYLADLGKYNPNYNNRMNIKIDDTLQNFINGHRMITYDRTVGKGYSE